MRNGDGTRLLINHNKLLRLYDGSIGVKTGFTKKAGRCLVSAAERDGLTLIVTPAYYEKTLVGRYVTDEESGDMLDIIFESRVYDLGNMFAWGGVFDLPGSLTRSGADKIASQVETKKKATETDMQKTLDAILAS